MIAILNYNVGNITSINNMLNRVGLNSVITADLNVIESASHLILPGVGSFDYCMKQLRQSPFYSHLNRLVFDDKKPILGVCVGHQMLFDKSEEGIESGLGWIKGKVVKFDSKALNLRVPHMGWNYVDSYNTNDGLFEGLELAKFYFVHSYYCIPESPTSSIAKTKYGIEFTSAIKENNILGVQFHPEKSHRYGMKLYENFSKI